MTQNFTTKNPKTQAEIDEEVNEHFEELALSWKDENRVEEFDGPWTTMTNLGHIKILDDMKEVSPDLRKLEEEMEKKTKAAYGMIQDLFNVFFQQYPRFRKAIPDWLALSKQVVEAVLTSETYRSLRPFTNDDDATSVMAILAMKKQILEILDKELKRAQEEAKKALDEAMQHQAMMDIAKQEGDKDAWNKAKKKRDEALAKADKLGKQYNQQVRKRGAKNRSVIRQGLKGALKDAKDASEAMASITWGTSVGDDPTKKNPKDRLEAAKAIREAKRLKSAAALIGKMKGLAWEKQKNKINKGASGIADITRGNDLARVCHTELANLASPHLRKLFLKKFVDRNLLQYRPMSRLKGTEGPMVVCLDVSGSMWGQRSDWAMATVLALLWISQRKQRPFSVVIFDGDVRKVWDLTGAGTKEIIDFASAEYGSGGTNFDAPLWKAIKIIETAPKFSTADIVFITDGECEVHAKEKIHKTLIDKCIHLYTFYVDRHHIYLQSLNEISTKNYNVHDIAGKHNYELGEVFDALV